MNFENCFTYSSLTLSTWNKYSLDLFSVFNHLSYYINRFSLCLSISLLFSIQIIFTSNKQSKKIQLQAFYANKHNILQEQLTEQKFGTRLTCFNLDNRLVSPVSKLDIKSMNKVFID